MFLGAALSTSSVGDKPHINQNSIGIAACSQDSKQIVGGVKRMVDIVGFDGGRKGVL